MTFLTARVFNEERAERQQRLAAIAAIPDSAFDGHHAVVSARASLVALDAEEQKLRTARAAIDGRQDVPARVVEVQGEIARKRTQLAAVELHAIESGELDMVEAVELRADLRHLDDLLASLEAGWAAFQAKVAAPFAEEVCERLHALTQRRFGIEQGLREQIARLKERRIDGEYVGPTPRPTVDRPAAKPAGPAPAPSRRQLHSASRAAIAAAAPRPMPMNVEGG